MRRGLFLWIGGILVFFVVVAVAIALNIGRFLEAPGQIPEKVDLVVALGGDAGARVRKAFELYRDGYAPYVLLTGIEGSDPGTRTYYLDWRAQYLVKRGVPQGIILFDLASTNTWEEAVNTRRLMDLRGWARVLVVSDPPHLRRLRWVWDKAFEGSGKQYRLIASPMVGWDANRWWQNERSAQFVLMEVIKLVYYKVAH
jgi:uncharacterized SAM-binding protein YcdF (DUF218 family)